MRLARPVLIASLLAISTLATGCGSTAESGDSANALTPDDVAARYGYQVASASMTPAFALVPEYKDPQDRYARDLLAHECLEGVYDYPVIIPRADPAAEGIDPRTLQRNFNEEIAAQWGYQIPPSPSIDARTGSAPAITPDVHEKMVECGKKTDERLGSPPQPPINAIEEAGWAAVETDPTVKAAAVEWRACMAPAGVVDLPENPHDMPSPSVVTPGSRESTGQGDQALASGVPASAREKEVAILDAQCRTEVGFDSAEFNARVRAELAAIGRDVQGFESAREQYEKYSAGVEEVVRELGG
jgi:hypothetical protein